MDIVAPRAPSRRSNRAMPLVAGLIVGLLAGQVGPLAPAAGWTPPRADTRVAQRFYAALDELFVSGDPTALRAAVAPSYADHALPAGIGASGGDLERTALAVRGVYPGVRLTAVDLVAGDDRIFARLSITGPGDGTFVGIPAKLAGAWPTIETLRIAGSAVAERWAGDDTKPLLENQGRAAIAAPPIRRQVVALAKLTIPPARRSTVVDGPGVVRVERGPLVMTVDRFSSEPIAFTLGAPDAAESVSLVRGDRRLLPTGAIVPLPPKARVSFSNDGDEIASAIVMALSPVEASYEGSIVAKGLAAAQSSDLATPQIVAGGFATLLAEQGVDRLDVAIGTLTVGPGASLPIFGAPGATLIAIDAGALSVAVTTGSAWWRAEDGISHDIAAEALASGGGVSIDAGSAIVLRNDGSDPTIAQILTIIPRTP